MPRPPPTILVDDDEPAVLSLTAMVLRLDGYEVTTAASGTEALAAARATGWTYDLLLTDVTMPGGVSGVRLADHLRRAKSSLKIVIVSGYNQELQEIGGLPPGTVYLHKPFELPKLVRTIRDCLDAQPTLTEATAD